MSLQLIGMSYKDAQKKLAELQAKLFSEDIDPAEAETLNIGMSKKGNTKKYSLL